MKTKTLLKIASSLMIVWIITFLAYYSYFIFNSEPINELEELFNEISSIILYSACSIYLIPLTKVYERFVLEKEDMILVLGFKGSKNNTSITIYCPEYLNNKEIHELIFEKSIEVEKTAGEEMILTRIQVL